MLTFFAIALFGLIVLVGGSIFGHDHDHNHDFGHGHDHDSGGNEPTVSIFSVKVIGMFVMGFGAAGTIARFYRWSAVQASLAGLGAGVLLGLVMYGVLRAIYGQQANSLVRTEDALGRNAIVTIGIGPDSPGQVEVSIGDLRRTYVAQSTGGKTFHKGDLLRVVDCYGSQLIVDKN